MSTQQLANQSNPPTQKEHIVAYLEIMDCENKMQNPQDSDLLLAQLAWIYNDVMKWPEQVKAGGHSDITVKIFSHNVLISMETGDDNHYPDNCYTVAKFCAIFQTMALTYGLFLHGAITVGKFASGKLQPDEKDNQAFFVYGEALVNAHSIAIASSLPRIIIDKCIFRNASPEDLLKNETLAEMYLQDEDGEYFLNPFRAFKSFKTEYKSFITNIIKEIREILLSEYAKTLFDKNISAGKHYFTLNLFNKFCSQQKEHESLQIPVKFFDIPWQALNKPRAELKTILDKKPPQSFTPPQQSRHIVAVLDFLGASNKMTSSADSDDFLRTIGDIYAEMTNFILANNMFNAWFAQTKTNEIKVQIFSDNVVLAKEYQKDTFVADCRDIFFTCSLFQICALMYQIPLRGAITCGNFCKNELFVYGDTFVKAHKMESQMAIYPRIIVDKDILALSNEISKINAVSWDKETTLIKQDFDGEWFVRYSYCSPSSGKQSFSWETLVKMRYGIIKAFESSPRNPSVRQKYCWLAKNFNEFCKEYACDDLAIELNVNGEPLILENIEVSHE